ncbi:MAG: recombination mediator RecR [Puniceicoccales bacterium]|jgi:recombination protein RecR|nr:recombination mediator RecR [Puniceicoccales bacterium]
MLASFDALKKILRRLPGIGYRSAERMALYLLLEGREQAQELIRGLSSSLDALQMCSLCGNLAEAERCSICSDPARDSSLLCLVETIPDLYAIERSGDFRGRYQVLGGKLSPIRGVLPQNLPLAHLRHRLEQEKTREVILALGGDTESEATCQYILREILQPLGKEVTRIGFGLPSGSGIALADADTLHTAILARRKL